MGIYIIEDIMGKAEKAGINGSGSTQSAVENENTRRTKSKGDKNL